MNKFKELLLRHPTRSKYILLILDIFFVLVATKMFINYTNIKQAIDETAMQSEEKQMELGYTENFQLPYERSEFAEFFLKHENNILLPKEFIIKFESIKPIETEPKEEKKVDAHFIKTPQESRKQFFYEKLIIKTNKNTLKE